MACTIRAVSAQAADCPTNDGTIRFGVEPYDTAAQAGADLREDRQADRRQARLQGRGVRRHQLQRRDRGDAQRQARDRRVRAPRLCAGASGREGRGGRRVRHRRRQARHLLGEHRHLPRLAASRRWPTSRATALPSPIRPRPRAICSRPMGCARPASIPTRTSSAIYAGSHTASFEALYNHKVDAGELNSEQLESATQRGHYKDGDLVFLWKSDPIPTDPFCVRGDLPDGFKQRLIEVLQNLDLSSLDPADRKIMVGAGDHPPRAADRRRLQRHPRPGEDAQHRPRKAELTPPSGRAPRCCASAI